MGTLILSSKFQIVIPKRIRESLKLKAGIPMQVIQYGDRIEMIPVKPITSGRGLRKGMDIDIVQAEERR